MKSTKFFILAFVLICSSVHAQTLYTAEFSLTEKNTGITGSGYLTFDNDTVSFGQVRADDVVAIYASIEGANNIVDNPASLSNTEFIGWDAPSLSFSSYTNFQSLSLGWYNYGGESSFSISGLSNKVLLEITSVYEGTFRSVPSLTCIGFDAPMDKGPVKVKKNRVLPLKAQIFDEESFVVDDQSINTAPVLSVSFSADGSGTDAIDVTDNVLSVGQGEKSNLFVYDTDLQQWRLNMKTSNLTEPGTYSLNLTSGDDSEYLFDTACTGTLVVK